MAVAISASVGAGGANRPADVRAIQQALNDLPPGSGGPVPPLKVDGICGPLTRAAILKFQQAHMGLAKDARVDRGGSTLSEINASLDPSLRAADPKSLAMESVPVSAFWTRLALAALNGPLVGNTRAALDTHFHTASGPKPEAHYLQFIRLNYTRVLHILEIAGQVFRSRSDAQATADQGVDPADGEPFPAYTFFAGSINFTRNFKPFKSGDGFGPMCRAAMVLHEPVHFIDRRADVNNDFYEHGSQYDSLTPEQAIHNPSSYVCFAEQITFGSDVRFGAGKPAQ